MPTQPTLTPAAVVEKWRGVTIDREGVVAVPLHRLVPDARRTHGQLLDYREDLENPPLLIVSDIERIEIHTNFTDASCSPVIARPP